tara:strand:- start:1314 stop:1454 length:141 start_codon:yes stop_codon:yes gene_type:complete
MEMQGTLVGRSFLDYSTLELASSSSFLFRLVERVEERSFLGYSRHA